MKYGLTILIPLLILALLLGIVVPWMIDRNTRSPETKRKWTDPKDRP